MDVIDGISGRRSERVFVKRSVSGSMYTSLVEAAICAPSGKNTQPWKFRVITDMDEKKTVADFSRCKKWMIKADGYILVFLDRRLTYDYVKGVLSCGAAIQNLLLAAHSLGLGSCWIGDVMDRSQQIVEKLGIADNCLELMGVIAVGYCDNTTCKASRRATDSFMI